MNTLKLAAMLMLTLGWTAAAISQTQTPTIPAGVGGGYATTSLAPATPGASAEWPQRKVTVSVQVDLAWDAKQLPLTDDDLRALAFGAVSGMDRLPVTFERIPLSKTPATAFAPAGPIVKADWQAARFTATRERSIVRGFLHESELRHEFVAFGADFARHTEAMMKELRVCSSKTYQRLVKEVNRLETQDPEAGAATQIEEARERMRALALDLAVNNARMDAIRQTISFITAQAAAKAAGDPILRELEKIRDLREAEVKRAKALEAVGNISPSAVAQAEINALEVAVKVAQRKEAVAAGVSADLLPKLSSEQAMLGIDDAEIRTKLKMLDMDLHQLETPAFNAKIKLQAAKNRLEAARCWAIIASPEPKVQDK